MRMTALLLLGLLLAPACARNQENGDVADDPSESARIRDTTLTPKDTLAPADTLPRIRDSLPDSTQSN
jgi:hypothetical protein